jgi:Holliday junction resolvase
MRARRTDANQSEIVECLRLIGYQVIDMSAVAAESPGFPDLLIAKNYKYWLAEVKRDDKARYTPDQLKWREAWQGSPPLRFNSAGDAMQWAKEVSAL